MNDLVFRFDTYMELIEKRFKLPELVEKNLAEFLTNWKLAKSPKIS